MKATLIPDKLTPMSAMEVHNAFRSAYETLCGKTPSVDCLAVLVAQSALECGRWKSLHCYNFGNAKAGPNYEGFYCQFRCNEVINGKLEWFDPPHPQCNFRAFQSAETGAYAQLKLLKERWPVAWNAAEAGAPLAFVAALHNGKYFTADPGPYSRSVASLFNEYRKLFTEQDDTQPDVMPPAWRRVLRIGSTGPDVSRLQSALNIGADGVYGPRTEAAVKTFQLQHGLSVDGIAGAITQEALYGGK